MATMITGTVYSDSNHNGRYEEGKPGIPAVSIVLYDEAGVCTPTRTDAEGQYRFAVTEAGTYTIYETGAVPTACPPTVFTQPEGFTLSNGPRKRTVVVTEEQIAQETVLGPQDFGHDTVYDPLSCSAQMIQFAGRPTKWYNINLVTGESTLRGPLTPEDDVNGIGYNPLDNYLYGCDITTGNLVRIGSSGGLMQLSWPTGLPAGGYNVGAFDNDGFLYLSINKTSRFYTVDLRPGSATFMKLVDPAAGYVEQTADYGTRLSTPVNLSDWAWDPTDGNLYGVQNNGVLTRISPTTGAVTLLDTAGPTPNDSFGAVGIDGTGTLYAILNRDGTVYQYDYQDGTASGKAFSKSSPANFNDGAMCPKAEIRVDYGDAPDLDAGTGKGNYHTLLDNNGPRHNVVNTLTLGSRVTTEDDAHQNADATGDDIGAGVQDDALALPLPPLSMIEQTYALEAAVTNETGSTANLYGWIDFNQNGRFEPQEAAPVTPVPSAAGRQTIPLTFTVPADALPNVGSTFLRLRLTTDTLPETPGTQDSRSVGPAADGEVEDYLLPILAVADLAVEKRADRDVLLVGDIITYTIQVTNYGPAGAADSILTDTVPAELDQPRYSLDGGATWQVWEGALPLGALAAGDSRTILLQGTYQGTGRDALVNTAGVTSSTPDPDLTNNTGKAETPAAVSADLSLTKTGAPNPAEAGGLLQYTLQVRNAGPSDAENTVLQDTLPPELSQAEFSADGGRTWAPWKGTHDIGTLESGGTRNFLLRAKVPADAAGELVNTATVGSVTPDPEIENNTATEVLPLEAAADLQVVKMARPDPVEVGGELTYTIVVTNAGPADAKDVVLRDEIPAGLSEVQFSLDGGASWQQWTGALRREVIPAGESTTILLRGTAGRTGGERLRNTVNVESSTPDPDLSNNTDTIETGLLAPLVPTPCGEADLAVTKSAHPASVSPGQRLTYTITAVNRGPDAAKDAVLYDTLPPELSAAEVSRDGGATWDAWATPYPLGELASGESRTLLVRARVESSARGLISNAVVVTSSTPDPRPGDNSDATVTPVKAGADLVLTKTAYPVPACRGQYLTYTLTVTNLGPESAEEVTVTDRLPDALSSPVFSLDHGAGWRPWGGSYSLDSLAPGASAEILVAGIVDPCACGPIVNKASATASTPDPNLQNNQARTETPVQTCDC